MMLSIFCQGLDSTLFLSWRAPFTLDITGIDPDIQYCVDVMTTTSSLTIACNIPTTEFSYPLPPDSGCHDYYKFTVTPVNVVGNGTPSSLYYFSNTTQECESHLFNY